LNKKEAAMGIRRPVVLLMLCLGMFGIGSARANPEDEAYHRGEYPKSFELLKPLAKDDDVAAQYKLGVLYANGQGVAQNYTRSAGWFRKAAEHDHARAQRYLGYLFETAKALPQISTKLRLDTVRQPATETMLRRRT